MTMLPETAIDSSRAQPCGSELAVRYWRIYRRESFAATRSKVKVFSLLFGSALSIAARSGILLSTRDGRCYARQ